MRVKSLEEAAYFSSRPILMTFLPGQLTWVTHASSLTHGTIPCCNAAGIYTFCARTLNPPTIKSIDSGGGAVGFSNNNPLPPGWKTCMCSQLHFPLMSMCRTTPYHLSHLILFHEVVQYRCFTPFLKHCDGKQMKGGGAGST